jgi:hypothetical protein
MSGLLQPLAIPSQCWEEISMDFITGLPKSEVNTVILYYIFIFLQVCAYVSKDSSSISEEFQIFFYVVKF